MSYQDSQASKEIELTNIDLSDFQAQKDFYTVYKRRFIMAAFFATSTISSSMMFSTTNPIASQLTQIYDISPTFVSLSANGFFLMHPILTFAQTYVANEYSVGLSIRIGCCLTLIGSVVRSMTYYTDQFSTVIYGQLIAGMGRPFIINTQANVAQDWFKPEDKTTVMIAFSFLITCSNIIGVMIPGMVFKGYNATNTESSIQQGKYLTGNLALQLMIIEVIIFSFFLIPPILFFQSKPPTPPGPVQNEHVFSYKESLKKVRENKNFQLLFCCYSLIMGGFHALAVVISYLFSPFNFNSAKISIIQSAPILCGFIGSITYSILIKKFKPNLKKVVLLSLIPVLGVSAFGDFIVMTQSYGLCVIMFGILGLFMIPVIPLQLEISTQVLHPVNQSISVGFLLAGVHLWSFIFGESLAFATNQQTKTEAFFGWLLLFISFLVAYICFSLVKLPKNSEALSSYSSNQQQPTQMTEERDTPEGPI